MRKTALLVFIAAFVPQAAAAKGGVKVLNSIPEAYWGTWAPGTGACTDGDKAAIVLSAKAYSGPLGKCDVASVSEIPSPKGPTYSARLRCTDPSEAQKNKPANVIIRPGEANQISAGPGFDSPQRLPALFKRRASCETMNVAYWHGTDITAVPNEVRFRG